VGKNLFWLAVAVGVVWYLSQREQAKTKIAANNAAAGAVNHAGTAVNNLIDQGASALGTWLSHLGGSSGQTSYSGGGIGGNAGPSFSTESNAFYDDALNNEYDDV
jgi:hypothetical protein